MIDLYKIAAEVTIKQMVVVDTCVQTARPRRICHRQASVMLDLRTFLLPLDGRLRRDRSYSCRNGATSAVLLSELPWMP